MCRRTIVVGYTMRRKVVFDSWRGEMVGPQTIVCTLRAFAWKKGTTRYRRVHPTPLRSKRSNNNISRPSLGFGNDSHRYFKMSSPGHRRQRSSQSATPRRAARNSSQALPSSPPPADDPAAAQLQVEHRSSQADSSGQRTPRGARAGIQSSSPLNFRSSPAPGGNVSRDVSSPLRQMSNTQTTDDRDRTPRASGHSQLLGGKSGESIGMGEWRLIVNRFVTNTLCF